MTTRNRRLRVEQLEDRTTPTPLLALRRNANALLRFDSAAPTVVTSTPLTGIVAGETMRAIDFRPLNDALYGLAQSATNDLRLYTINPLSGTATPFPGTITPAPGATFVGMGFNPTVDRIRVVMSNDDNLRINPDTGARADAPANDTDLNPAGVIVESVAYTNSFPTATSTTLFTLNLQTNSLARIGGVGGVPSPNGGVVTDIGPIGFAFNANGTALDIGQDGVLYAGIRPNAGTTNLYTINQDTGAATLVGLIGDGSGSIDGLAVVPEEPARVLSLSGTTNGRASLYVAAADSGGAYPAAAFATVAAFGTSSSNVRTAVGDVNGDSIEDTVVVTGSGTPLRLAVISGVDNTTALVAPFDPFGGDFTGGGFVAVGDIDNDGRDEFLVSPDQGGGPRVTVFSLVGGVAVQKQNFFGIDDPAFRGGARVALGDINRDGTNDLAVSAGFLGGPRVALFDGKSMFGTPTRLIGDFFGFPGTDATTLRNGVFLAVGDVNGDGFADLVLGGGPGGAPRIFVLGGAFLATGDVAGAQAAPIANFFVAGDTVDRGGVRVAVKNADGDNRADVVVGSGEGRATRARIYLAKNFSGTGEPATFQDLDPFGAVLPGGVFVG